MNAEQSAPSGDVQRLPHALPALLFGIATYIALGPFGAVPAAICGHKALNTYRTAPGRYYGKGMATAGLILGWLGIVLSVIAVVCMFLVSAGQDSADFTFRP